MLKNPREIREIAQSNYDEEKNIIDEIEHDTKMYEAARYATDQNLDPLHNANKNITDIINSLAALYIFFDQNEAAKSSIEEAWDALAILNVFVDNEYTKRYNTDITKGCIII